MDGLCFYCLFSYSSLGELQYGERIQKSQIATEQARETGILVREAECRIDIRLFLNEYPRLELGAPHQSVILHKMFLHAAEWGQKEAECMVHGGCWDSTSEPNLEAGQSAMKLVGYWTSCKEIWDIYHSIYLLRRPLGLSSCWDWLRRETIHDILSFLTGQLHQCGHPAVTSRDPESKKEWLPRPNRRESYEEALKVANQRVLDTAEALQGNIERLSQRTRGTSQTHSRICSRSRTRTHSRSHSRSHSRAHSQSHPWSDSWSRQPRSTSRPPPGKRVTFREPEVEPNSKGGVEDYSPGPPVSDMETWLEWKACQLSTPTWWSELTAILGWRTCKNLPTRFEPPSLSPKLGWGPSCSGSTLCPLPLNASTEMPSIQMNYHTRMYGRKLFS